MTINGAGVAVITTGALLLWAGIKNENPVDLLKDTLGRPSEKRKLGTPFGAIDLGEGTFAPHVAGSVSPTTPPGAGGGDDIVAEARKHLGARYVWATAGPDTFDCSGLVVYCLRHTRWPNCPRFTTYSFGSWAKGAGWTRLDLSQVASGDVIVKSGHMAIAISNTRMIAAPHTGTVVKDQLIYSRPAWWGWRPPAAPTGPVVQT